MGHGNGASLALTLTPRWQALTGLLLPVWAWACVPSVPPAELADAQPEYRTPAFTVRAPAGRWVTDSVAIARGLDPGGCVYAQGNPPPYDTILGSSLGQVRFLELRGFVLDLFGVGVSDVEECLTITAWEVAAPYRYPDVDSLVTKVRSWVEARRSWDGHSGFWGNRGYETVGRLVDTTVAGRAFYEVRAVALEDSTVKLNMVTRPRVLLYLTPMRLFEFVFNHSEAKLSEPHWRTVLTSFTPLE